MNVTCPQCATVFRVDPAKVPEQGVRARCSVCSALIAVRRPELAAPATPPAPTPAPAPQPVAPPVAIAPPAAPAPPPSPQPVPQLPTGDPFTAFAPATPLAPMGPPAPPLAQPTPPVAARPEAPPPPPPASPPTEAAAAAPARGTSAARPANPFMQQDPSTRARRLARALVSDLVVYYPEKRQRGLAEGNLKELFAEEIRKSWEEYSEQVGADIAANTPYFTEALNEILAEGRALFG
jgi:predicted Zn finger-like uncharacterized protein